MSDLQSLTAETFQPLLGQTFRMQTGEGASIDTELISVEPHGDGQGDRRPQFSILLRGPRKPVFAQGIYRLEHPRLGTLDLFIVPIGPDKAGIIYEAVFA